MQMRPWGKAAHGWLSSGSASARQVSNAGFVCLSGPQSSMATATTSVALRTTVYFKWSGSAYFAVNLPGHNHIAAFFARVVLAVALANLIAMMARPSTSAVAAPSYIQIRGFFTTASRSSCCPW